MSPVTFRKLFSYGKLIENVHFICLPPFLLYACVKKYWTHWRSKASYSYELSARQLPTMTVDFDILIIQHSQYFPPSLPWHGLLYTIYNYSFLGVLSIITMHLWHYVISLVMPTNWLTTIMYIYLILSWCPSLLSFVIIFKLCFASTLTSKILTLSHSKLGI